MSRAILSIYSDGLIIIMMRKETIDHKLYVIIYLCEEYVEMKK